MRYPLQCCNCRVCADEAPYVKCPWRAKTLHCQKVNLVDILETGKHVTDIHSTPKPRLTSEMKTFAQDMTAQGLKPVCIRNGILRKFNLALEELPLLSTIQHFCQHYASTKLRSNDYMKETHKMISDASYPSSMDEHESFMFTLNTDANGRSAIGIGSDHQPFIVGITSRRLLMRASCKAGTRILHVDATFKLNQVGYLVIVVGVSDCARIFHLVALFVSSQRAEPHYTEMFSALNRIHWQVLGKALVVQLVMVDADGGQLNGIRQGLDGGADVKYLMCFYHVVAKVFERTRGLLPSQANTVVRRYFPGNGTGEFSQRFFSTVDALQQLLSNRFARPVNVLFYGYFYSGFNTLGGCLHLLLYELISLLPKAHLVMGGRELGFNELLNVRRDLIQFPVKFGRYLLQPVMNAFGSSRIDQL